jgi:hypothetical protein
MHQTERRIQTRVQGIADALLFLFRSGREQCFAIFLMKLDLRAGKYERTYDKHITEFIIEESTRHQKG